MLKFWKDRLATEQAQIDATRRAIARRTEEAKYFERVNKTYAPYAWEHIAGLEKNLKILEVMRETLMDQLGQAGILELIEKR